MMADSLLQDQNGVPEGATASSSTAGNSGFRLRNPLSIVEALPCTSFSSIIPILTDIVPTPSILGSALPISNIRNWVSRGDFDALAAEALASPFSEALQLSVDQAHHLLSRPIRFTFKKPLIGDFVPTTGEESLAAGLSPFSKMVLNKARIAVRYPTPDTPTSAFPSGQAVLAATKQQSPLVPKSETPRPRSSSSSTIVNKQAYAHNAEISIPIKGEHDVFRSAVAPPVNRAVPPARTDARFITPTPAEPRPNLTIELTPPTFDRDACPVIPYYPEAPESLSTPRQRNEYGNRQEIYGSLDQHQRVDAALSELRRCLQDVFAAEHDRALQRVYPLLQKVISLNCFDQVPLEELLHLQRLGAGALAHSVTVDFRIDDVWGEPEVDAWAQQLPEVDTGLKAARTSLSIMCGGRKDKQLYSEDIIQSAVDLFKKVLDGIIVPVAELRSSGPSEPLFKQLSGHRKVITTIFTSCQRLFGLMATVASKTDLSDTVMNTLEFAASQLMFVENAHMERDSVLGVQKFDGLRLVAMDMLCQIFLMSPQQRAGIFGEILTSLEKLPVGRQSARQFKLVDGRSIQPVSALIMRLVQASAGMVDDTKFKRRAEAATVARGLEDGESDDDYHDSNSNGNRNDSEPGVRTLTTITSESRGAVQHSTAIQELFNVVGLLRKTADRNAAYVVAFIVKRAQRSSKTGDTPYRNLLDLFVEDFTTCLGSPDWPAAELLLRQFMVTMVNVVEGDRQPAPAKNMALEVLGVLGAAISKLRSQIRTTAGLVDTTDQNGLDLFLAELAGMALEGKSRSDLMVAWTGPYRAVVEYLEVRCSEDPHLSSAVSYVVMDWASRVNDAYEDSNNSDDDERDGELGRLAYRLRMMIGDRKWLSTEYSFKAVTAAQAKLSQLVILVRSQLCENFPRILHILLRSMSNDQATVRSKSLKSINQVMDTDPSILDGDSATMQQILQCLADSSTQVRDSALGLIGKAISLRPALEEPMLVTVMDRFTDAAVGVRKRAIKLAKDIYLRNTARQVRSAIANGVLNRIQDPEEGVRELARQTIEEIWIVPFFLSEGTAAFQTALNNHVALMVQTLDQGPNPPMLDKVIQTILSPTSKTAKANFEVCRRLVASMFDAVDNPGSDDQSLPSGRSVLQLLMIFAKADARLFTFEQIRLLMPQIQTVNNNDDVATSRALVVIYCRVLPQLSSVHADFLVGVRKALTPAVSNASRALADDVFACLHIICKLLDSFDSPTSLARSSLKAIEDLRQLGQRGPLKPQDCRKFQRYALIIGMLGKHYDPDRELSALKLLAARREESVSEMMVQAVIPWAEASQPPEVRKSALDSVGLICESWPRNYVTPRVYRPFQDVFDERNPVLENTIMRSLKAFLTKEEMRSEEASEAAAAEKVAGTDTPQKRELTRMGTTNHDDVASATTQRFLKEISRIALGGLDEHAHLAIEILGTINRQGLVHPKETGVTLITLETSPVARIADLAFQGHKALHGKHETVLEREYAKAIQSAFQYQRDIAQDSHGATKDPYVSKLHLLMNVLKDSRSKNRQRLMEKMCGQIDFDPNKLDVSSDEMPGHVEFSRFVIENLAYLEYMTIGEVLRTVTAMEKIFHTTGLTVAHAIESELFRVRMETERTLQPIPDGEAAPTRPAGPAIDPFRLRQLTASSMILHCLWEARTYLRRLYNLKGKVAPKDLSKTPTRNAAISGDKFWDEAESIMTALESQSRMLDECRTFAELLNEDKEHRVPDDDEEMDDEHSATLSSDDDGSLPDRARKRKAGGTPGRKKRARSASQERGERKRGRPRKNVSLLDEDAYGDPDDGMT